MNEKLTARIKSELDRDPGITGRDLFEKIGEDFGLAPRTVRGHLKRVREIPTNILVIGDLHTPFDKCGYLDHCLNVYNEFNCNKVILIGDIIDNHYSSYHETDPDGHGAGDELERAIQRLNLWHNAFPNADVVLGNHDLLAMRKTFSAGLSKKWLRAFEDVLRVPTWRFHDEIYVDGVCYCHGTGSGGQGGARLRALSRNESTVMGHTHTEASITWHANTDKRFFGMYVGCGVDEKAYAMEYGKHNKRKMIISCATVLNNGQLPIVHPMNLT